jgi:hypothetical protein
MAPLRRRGRRLDRVTPIRLRVAFSRLLPEHNGGGHAFGLTQADIAQQLLSRLG